MRTLNLKHPEIYELASELAHRRHSTITSAVLDAVRSELEREKSKAQKIGMASRLLKIGETCAKHVAPGTTSASHDDLLYDEFGLPR
ncbi:MAG: type II toxin-antitoxin system VapB family antitoxin [Bryobacteraceae bacterium]